MQLTLKYSSLEAMKFRLWNGPSRLSHFLPSPTFGFIVDTVLEVVCCQGDPPPSISVGGKRTRDGVDMHPLFIVARFPFLKSLSLGNNFNK